MLSSETPIRTDGGEVALVELRGGTTLRALTEAGLTRVLCRGIRYRNAPPELIRLETRSGRTLVVTPDQPMFARMVPGPTRYDVVLVKEQGLGAFLVAGPRGIRETSPRRFFYRKVPEGQSRCEQVFLLASLPSEAEAMLHRKRLNARFGVPEATGGYRDMGPEEWRTLFLEIDTILRAHELLEELGLDPEDPHWVQRSLDPSALRKHLLVEAVRFQGDWFVEVRRPESGRGQPLRLDAHVEAERLRDLISYEGLDYVDVDRRHELGWPTPYRRLRAAAVHPGMGLPLLEDERRGEDVVVRVERVPGDGMVYEVDATSTVGAVANGLLVGADRHAPSKSKTDPKRRP
jgi:hypothetical protein